MHLSMLMYKQLRLAQRQRKWREHRIFMTSQRGHFPLCCLAWRHAIDCHFLVFAPQLTFAKGWGRVVSSTYPNLPILCTSIFAYCILQVQLLKTTMICQQLHRFEKEDVGESYNWYMIPCWPCRQPASNPSGRSWQLELCVQSCEPVWVMKHGQFVHVVHFLSELSCGSVRTAKWNDTAICNFCIILNQY